MPVSTLESKIRALKINKLFFGPPPDFFRSRSVAQPPGESFRGAVTLSLPSNAISSLRCESIWMLNNLAKKLRDESQTKRKRKSWYFAKGRQNQADSAVQPFFSKMSWFHLGRLAGLAMETRFEPRQFIFKQGDPANRFYLVQESEVLMEIQSQEGGRIPIRGSEMMHALLQPGFTASKWIIGFALRAVLLIARIVPEPFFKFGESPARNPKRKQNRRKLKARPGRHRRGRNVVLTILFPATLLWSAVSQAQSLLAPSSTDASAEISKPATLDVWQNGVGNGFRAGAQSMSLGLAAGHGVEILGGRQCHDLALASLSYGYMLGPVEGQGHWYRGNWELRGELFSGAQFSPSTEWLVGLTPHLRYNFATGIRWIPYVDIGAGVSATSIGPPDLSRYFEFNLQAATGVRWFIRDNVALGVEAGYLHMSCAGLSSPNLGLNNVGGMCSITWFF